MAFIYIATNDTLWFPDNGRFTPLIKIGYTNNADIDQRMNQLNRATSSAGKFKKFASYEIAPIEGIAAVDRLIHKIIQEINPNLRLDENKEYFIWEPESAYRFFEAMAQLHGRSDKLVRYVPQEGPRPSEDAHQTGRGGARKPSIPPADFFKLGIPVGAILRYRVDESITCTVLTNRKVMYQGRKCSLSSVAEELLHRHRVQGTLWFTYEGKTIAKLWSAYCATHPVQEAEPTEFND